LEVSPTSTQKLLNGSGQIVTCKGLIKKKKKLKESGLRQRPNIELSVCDTLS